MATLFEKIYGCISASHIGSSMGAVVEGWDKSRIYEKYGVLDKLLPYEHYGNKWLRPPGTTEDGIERQKLMLTAIIEKKDRVTAEDVVARILEITTTGTTTIRYAEKSSTAYAMLPDREGDEE